MPVRVGVLPHQDIVELAEPAGGLIAYFDKKQVKTASYDMRVGQKYYLSSDEENGSGTERFRTQTLDGNAAGIVIEPTDVVVVEMLEELNLPPDVVGHLSLKVERLFEGLIMATQSQIDAGYKGKIWALLYNLSDRRIVLKPGEECVRLEFERMQVKTGTYSGEYGVRGDKKTLADVLPKPLNSSLRKLSRDFNELKSGVDTIVAELEARVDGKLEKLTSNGIIALITLVFTVFLAFVPWLIDLEHQVSDLKQTVGMIQGRRWDVAHLEKELRGEQRHLARLIIKAQHLEHHKTHSRAKK